MAITTFNKTSVTLWPALWPSRKLVEAIRPQVLCKGADYKRKQNVVGWDLVERWGGRVVLVELIEGRSTTGLIRRAKS